MTKTTTHQVMGTIEDDEIAALRQALAAINEDLADVDVDVPREGWRSAKALSPDLYLVLNWQKLIDWDFLEVEWLNEDQNPAEAGFRLTLQGRHLLDSIDGKPKALPAPLMKTTWLAEELVADMAATQALREAVAAGRALLRDRGGEVCSFPVFLRDETLDFDYRYTIASTGAPLVAKCWATFTVTMLSTQLDNVRAIRAELPREEPQLQLVGPSGITADALGECMRYAQQYGLWEVGQKIDTALDSKGGHIPPASGRLVGYVAGIILRLRNMADAHARPHAEASEYAALVQAVRNTADHLQEALDAESDA